ncbi:predicted protein [Naegleria gruberi]|uniref:peptidylprolyl isomerase n=1 Tax=Naegleria gruberi TaxID=5762 RepID=D2VAV4_NAEGR|nr:uncharacterized protein NAEGRDRAFT_32557 [Naegleria gruberi]EFC46146.1 predicted protein [Naegleria gruberi]|eukprot:XP_002678890.1 predicted protein [Naegleria gruberi strain NEG-M]
MRFTLVVALLLVVTFCVSSSFAKYEDLKRLQVGVKYRPNDCDRKIKDGDKIDVHYRGTLTDGTEFDSSYSRNQPFSFTIGQGSVIKGWDAGLQGACVGEKRKLVIPSEMGYGSRAMGKIPANSVLIFDVEVVAIN